MEYQQPHSKVEKRGGEFIMSNNASHNTTGTRIKEIALKPEIITVGGGTLQWMVPLYNLFDIELGTASSQRLTNSIYVRRIEFEFCLSEWLNNVIGPDESSGTPGTSFAVLTDPRYRIMIVNPKFGYNILPVDANTTPTFPYFSNTSANYPVKLNPPIPFDYNNFQGMLGLPDPKRYAVEFDDLRTIREHSPPGHDAGSFSFLVNRRFDYIQESYSKSTIQLTDQIMQELIPQVWFFTPWSGISDNGSTITTNIGSLKWECKMRMIYDNVA